MQLAWETIMLPYNRKLLAMHKPMLQSDPIVYTNQVSQAYCNLRNFHFEYVDLT
jgi:hypothetical protein